MPAQIREGLSSRVRSSAPATPSSGKRLLYPKADGWYEKDDAGVETKLGAGGGGAPVQTEAPANPTTGQFWYDSDEPAASVSGGVPLSLYDAKGDILLGTGSDTVAKKSVGTNGQFLVPDSTSADGWRFTSGAGVGLIDEVYGSSVMATSDYASTTPPTVTTGVRMFARYRARRLPAFIGPDGQDSQLQPALFTNRIARLNAVNNAATQQLDGLAVTNIAAPTAVAAASTNFYTSMVRHRYTSTATAGNGCGTRSASAQWFRSATANMGGFFFVCRFGLNAVTATNRMFIGMSATTTALAANANPSTYLNMIGFAADSSHTTMRLMHNDASGTATVVDVGPDFPVQTAATYFYEVRLYAPSANASIVYYSAHRLNDGVVVLGSVTTDLPAAGTMLAAHVHHSNGTTAAAVSTDLQSLYIETDN